MGKDMDGRQQLLRLRLHANAAKCVCDSMRGKEKHSASGGVEARRRRRRRGQQRED